MRVLDLLNVKGHDVATISRGRSIADALVVLRDRGIGALIVTGREGPLLGILSERDVVRALAVQGASILEMNVEDLMSASVTTCAASTSLEELMATMTERRIRHVPVLESDRVIGIISIGDVVKARLDELEVQRRELIDYVNAR